MPSGRTQAVCRYNLFTPQSFDIYIVLHDEGTNSAGTVDEGGFTKPAPVAMPSIGII